MSDPIQAPVQADAARARALEIIPLDLTVDRLLPEPRTPATQLFLADVAAGDLAAVKTAHAVVDEIRRNFATWLELPQYYASAEVGAQILAGELDPDTALRTYLGRPESGSWQPVIEDFLTDRRETAAHRAAGCVADQLAPRVIDRLGDDPPDRLAKYVRRQIIDAVIAAANARGDGLRAASALGYVLDLRSDIEVQEVALARADDDDDVEWGASARAQLTELRPELEAAELAAIAIDVDPDDTDWLTVAVTPAALDDWYQKAAAAGAPRRTVAWTAADHPGIAADWTTRWIRPSDGIAADWATREDPGLHRRLQAGVTAFYLRGGVEVEQLARWITPAPSGYGDYDITWVWQVISEPTGSVQRWAAAHVRATMHVSGTGRTSWGPHYAPKDQLSVAATDSYGVEVVSGVTEDPGTIRGLRELCVEYDYLAATRAELVSLKVARDLDRQQGDSAADGEA